MKPVCASAKSLKIIDISHYEPTVNWKMVKAAGIAGAYLKATEGINVRDALFATHRANAKLAGIPSGAYHFFHPAQDPIAQAKFFVGVIGQMDPTDLPPVIDWETNDSIPAAKDVTNGMLFINEVQALLKRRVMVYGAPYFLQDLAGVQALSEHPLWIAHYTNACPLIPPPWANWVFWQFTDSGAVPGLGPAGTGKCDVSWFNGTVADLAKFCSDSILA